MMSVLTDRLADEAGCALNTARPLTHSLDYSKEGLAVDATPARNLCGCGCGEPAGIYSTSNSAAGIVAGQPKKYIHGHHSRVQKPRVRDFDTCYTVMPDGCWRWNRIQQDEDGYGSFWANGRKKKAHRYSYERSHGTIPAGVNLDHTCHDPDKCRGGPTCPHRACVNPEHLTVTTHAINCRRGVLAKLDLTKAREIRHRFAAGETGIALAKEFQVTPSTISMVVRHRTWREDA